MRMSGRLARTGWRQVEVRDPQTWSHFGGNNDGVFDGPVSKITIAIDPVNVHLFDQKSGERISG